MVHNDTVEMASYFLPTRVGSVPQTLEWALVLVLTGTKGMFKCFVV